MIPFKLTDSEKLGLRVGKLRAIARNIVNRHNLLKDPKNGEYGQDIVLFGYLDQLDAWFKDNPMLKKSE